MSASIVGYLKMLVTLGAIRHQLAIDYDLPDTVRRFVRRLARQQGLALLDPRLAMDRLYAGAGQVQRGLHFVDFLEAQEPAILEAEALLFGFRNGCAARSEPRPDRHGGAHRRRRAVPRDGLPR